MKGIDLSKHNSVPDYAVLSDSGISFAMLRAGLGGTVIKELEQNVDATNKGYVDTQIAAFVADKVKK